jgi:hypothetical protein
MMRRTNGKTNDAGLTFSPAFRYSGISFSYRQEKCGKKSQRGLNFSLKILVSTQEKISTV